MPVVITPTDTYPANFQVAQDGDFVNQATRTNVMQEYADAANHLRNRTVPTGGWSMAIPIGVPVINTTSAYSFDQAKALWQETLGNGDTVVWPVPVPFVEAGVGRGWQIDAVTAWTINITGHGGSAPTGNDRQAVTMYYLEAAAGTPKTNVFATSYDPSSAAVLDTLHSFGATSIAHQVKAGGAYWIEFKAETGVNAAPDTDIHAIVVDFLPV
jgi:hypothetical protein